jgi:hypothetical protein
MAYLKLSVLRLDDLLARFHIAARQIQPRGNGKRIDHRVIPERFLFLLVLLAMALAA